MAGWVLSISKDGDIMISMGNLLGCLMTLRTRMCLLTFKWNFLISVCDRCLSCLS